MGLNLCWMLYLHVSFLFVFFLLPLFIVWIFFKKNRYFFIPETKGLTLEQIDLLYRESSGNVLFLFFLFFPIVCLFPNTFLFCFLIAVIGSEAYRRKMVEQNETFTTNLQHAKVVRFSLSPILISWAKKKNLTSYLFISPRIISTTMKKATMYKRTHTYVLSSSTTPTLVGFFFFS